MKVLIATTHTQGEQVDDYSWALDGELVYVPVDECSNPDCGCDRGFAGMASDRATTTAMVVDRSTLGPADLSILLIDSLTRQGWLADGWSAANEEFVDLVWSRLQQALEHFPVGSILERQGDVVRSRALAVDDVNQSV